MPKHSKTWVKKHDWRTVRGNKVGFSDTDIVAPDFYKDFKKKQGWHESKKPIVIDGKVKNKAPRHRKAKLSSIQLSEPRLISDPRFKYIDPEFEKSEDERLKEESEHEIDNDSIDYYDTGKLKSEDLDELRYSPFPEPNLTSPEEEEFNDLFAEAVFKGAINTDPAPNKLTDPVEIRYRWWSAFNRNPDETIKKLRNLIDAVDTKI